MDHTAFVASVDPETRARLTEPQNAPGLIHLAGHFAIIVVLAAWIALGWPGWPLVMVPLGIALAFLFTLQHECTHATPFQSRWLNDGVGIATGVILIQPFYWFRAFHMAHHRYTNIPGKDPELDTAKPESWRDFTRHLIGLGYWRAKIDVLITNARGRADAPYLSDRMGPRLRTEARAMVAVYALAALFTVFVSPILIWVWLIPLALGFPFLRLYLLAEHGRCPAVANMFENTRTTLTNRIVRFLAWNMPFHAEHHAWPTVPFHKLGEVHDLSQQHLNEVSPGYAAFARDYTAAFQPPG